MSDESVSQQAKRRGFGVIQGGKKAGPEPAVRAKAKAAATGSPAARAKELAPINAQVQNAIQKSAAPTAKQVMQQRAAERAVAVAASPVPRKDMSVRKASEEARANPPTPGVVLDISEAFEPAAPPENKAPPQEAKRDPGPPPPPPPRPPIEQEYEDYLGETGGGAGGGTTRDPATEVQPYTEEEAPPAASSGSSSGFLLVLAAAAAWFFFGRGGGASVAGVDEVDVTPGALPLPELPPTGPGAYHDVVIDEPSVFAPPKSKKKKRSR